MFTVRFLNYAGDDLLGIVEAEYGEDITDRAPEPEVIPGKYSPAGMCLSRISWKI